MRDFVQIDIRYQALFQQLKLKDYSGVITLFGGECAVKSPEVVVEPRTISLPTGETMPVFFKQYAHPAPSWRFWMRRSKARCEFENYAVFDRLEIACAERIACGERRDGLGRLCHAFILTRAIPHTVTLPDFVSGRKSIAVTRNKLRHQLADMTRRLHEAGFFHNDLYWRNILVEIRPDGELKLWWIDCPRGGFACWLSARRLRIKDLAALDLEAVKFCRRTERIRFLLDYLSKAALDETGSQFARQIMQYRLARWPE